MRAEPRNGGDVRRDIQDASTRSGAPDMETAGTLTSTASRRMIAADRAMLMAKLRMSRPPRVRDQAVHQIDR